MEKKTIGSFISVLRKANGLTQKQLAEKLCVSDAAVSRWERDECAPDISLIPVIAELFNVTSDEIIRGERLIKSAPEPGTNLPGTQKQVERLMHATVKKFTALIIVTIGLTVLGVLISYFVNFVLENEEIAYLVISAVCLLSTILASVFLIFSLSAIDGDEFAGTVQAKSKINIVTGFLISVSISITTLIFFGTYISLSASIRYVSSYLIILELYPLIFLFGTLLICITVSCFIVSHMKRKAGLSIGEKESGLRKRLLKLKIGCLIATALLLWGMVQVMDTIRFSDKTYAHLATEVFDNKEEYQAYMASEKPEYYQASYYDPGTGIPHITVFVGEDSLRCSRLRSFLDYSMFALSVIIIAAVIITYVKLRARVLRACDNPSANKNQPAA
ncbi:MAG: helix-turn-helix domain-containing protein [Clostridiales bacterium]|nr:helix-turn-helix domain-containing protein [Clostridiales bacterium]